LLDTLDKATAEALDPYATVRSLYRQHRTAEIEAVRNDTRATPPDWVPAQPAH
jgi:phospholipid-binding lipoprotein MlaA